MISCLIYFKVIAIVASASSIVLSTKINDRGQQELNSSSSSTAFDVNYTATNEDRNKRQLTPLTAGLLGAAVGIIGAGGIAGVAGTSGAVGLAAGKLHEKKYEKKPEKIKGDFDPPRRK